MFLTSDMGVLPNRPQWQQQVSVCVCVWTGLESGCCLAQSWLLDVSAQPRLLLLLLLLMPLLLSNMSLLFRAFHQRAATCKTRRRSKRRRAAGGGAGAGTTERHSVCVSPYCGFAVVYHTAIGNYCLFLN